ncbi:PREDICTED: terpene synthase 10-like [Nelumbo nucifera]|uniref:Terpene synthase 10-like n=2 Tax=Nelumbo nucifera TaxID=4432 RepID=A0A1U7Z9Y2_NELNU|nr:PREDICTED: terpene synthase 10-like [Nelumbo nucifera]DAD22514.1 TPA_asm: hypothetical protein HUJ06_023977 [Nelumbo nucifera]
MGSHLQFTFIKSGGCRSSVLANSFLIPLSSFSTKKFSQGRCLHPVRPLQNAQVIKHIQLHVRSQLSNEEVIRRSGNYKPSSWENDDLQSLKSDFPEEAYVERATKLVVDVKRKFNQAAGAVDLLELIDNVQRLGVGYHFQTEIKRALESIKDTSVNADEELYATALRFRLLRQHGFQISQDVFKSFMDKKGGSFNESLRKDTKGLLDLYEASYHGFEGEDILDGAQQFTKRHLIKQLKEKTSPNYKNMARLVSHALEMPLHWRMNRWEARWFIDTYSMKQDMDPLILEFAKLDFNMVQAIYQQELKDASRWWTDLGLAEALRFSRDRIVENYLWTTGIIFEPQFGYCRRQLTKANCLITTIDDVYDVYGTLDELKLFTDAVERWDINTLRDLPDYMKICFMALYNNINEMAYDFLKKRGWDILKYLKKGWLDLCKTYLVEAQWYYNGYKPTLEEYLNNAWISISAPTILVHNYFCVENKIKEEALEQLDNYPSIVRSSGALLRYSDDLGTSTDELKRGDVPKSIQCYMHETGAPEEIAREHIRGLRAKEWKKMNKCMTAPSPFPQAFKDSAAGLGRMAQFMYQHGDGHGLLADSLTKNRIMPLLVHPIPLD